MAKEIKKTEQLRMEGVPKEGKTPSDKVPEENQDTVLDGQMSVFEDVSGAIIDESAARERLEEAIESEKPKKKKKSIITNLIFLAINLCVLGFIISACLNEAGGVPLSKIISNQGSKLWWLVLGLGLFFIKCLADTMMFFCLIKKSTGKNRFFLSYKVSAVGKYFDAITPFSVGGQPSQILNLARAGLTPGVASSIPIIKLIIFNIVYTVLILITLVVGVPFLPVSSSLNNLLFVLFKIFAYLGLFFTALTSVLFFLIGGGKIIGRSAVRWLVRTGYKLRIVKDYRKTYNKIMGQVLEYQSSMKYLHQHKGTLAWCILFGAIDVIAHFAMPFAIVMAFSPNNIVSATEIFTILGISICKFVVCQMAAVVIPLPGGTGMMEFSFIALFGVSSLIGSTNIVWGLLAWRFLTYYFTILQGFIISTVDTIVRITRARKEMKVSLKN